MPGETYLGYPMPEIRKFLGDQSLKILFIPYAAVTFSFDEYEARVKERFAGMDQIVTSIHHAADFRKAVGEAEAIVVGGGNTWQLVRMMNDNGLFPLIRERVLAGIPFIGWSAGSNVACPTLRTTNDMPIVDPKGFDCLNLVPVSNQSALPRQKPGRARRGNPRTAELKSFWKSTPEYLLFGLREGTMLRREGDRLMLIGPRTARIFKKGSGPVELNEQDNLNFLLDV